MSNEIAPGAPEVQSGWVDGYLPLLLLITVVFGLLMLIDFERAESGWAEVLAVGVTALTAAVLALALHASAVSARRVRIALGIGGFTVLATSVSYIAGSAWKPGFIWVLLVAVTPIVVMRRVAQHKEVTTETLLGAICAYLLIALTFSYLFVGLDSWFTAPFFGTEEPSTAFPYFSLVTIATLGYGDLAPDTDIGRVFSAGEAIVGQVYLVIVVARLVSLYTGRSKKHSTKS